MNDTLTGHLTVATCIGCGARAAPRECPDGCADDRTRPRRHRRPRRCRRADRGARGPGRGAARARPRRGRRPAVRLGGVQERAREAIRLPVPPEPDIAVIEAWGCPRCGRIDAPQPCLGVCVRRPGAVADASEYRQFAERSAQLAADDRTFTGLARPPGHRHAPPRTGGVDHGGGPVASAGTAGPVRRLSRPAGYCRAAQPERAERGEPCRPPGRRRRGGPVNADPARPGAPGSSGAPGRVVPGRAGPRARRRRRPQSRRRPGGCGPRAAASRTAAASTASTRLRAAKTTRPMPRPSASVTPGARNLSGASRKEIARTIPSHTQATAPATAFTSFPPSTADGCPDGRPSSSHACCGAARCRTTVAVKSAAPSAVTASRAKPTVYPPSAP